MALESTQTPPHEDQFTPLTQYGQQTPSSFFGGKTVLHLKSLRANLRISKDDLESQPALLDISDGTGAEDSDGQTVIRTVDVWVTSR